MGKTHALYSPSRLPMLAECPGWVSGGSSEAADRGTLIHDIVARLIEGRSIPKKTDPEAVHIAELGYAYFQDLKAQYPAAVWHVEKEVSAGLPECWGTSDLIGHDELNSILIVLDWKSGRGLRPNAAESLQMKAYAAAALRKYPADTVIMQVIELEGRESSMSEHAMSEVPGWLKRISEVIETARRSGPELYSPFHGCRYCGRSGCPAMHSLAVQTGSDIASMPPDPADLIPADVSMLLDRVLPALDLIDAYAGKLKARAISIIEAGGDVPGYGVFDKAGARKWRDEKIAQESLPKEINQDIWELASPAKVEKLLVATGMKKKEASALLSGLTMQAAIRTLKKIETKEEAA